MSGSGYFHTGDNVNAVVADVGSYATKIGFAGEDYPKSYFRSNTACLQDPKNKDNLTIKYDYYSRPLDHDNDYNIANPVDPATGLWYGENEDWYTLVEKYLQHGYSSALNAKTHHHPLLMVERSYNPPPIRQAVLELLMEDLQVPAVFLGRDATLACYACGRTTGTVVDIGHSGVTITPVYEGYVESKGIRRLPFGTNRLDELVMQNLDTLHKTPFLPLYQVQQHPKVVAGIKQRQESIHNLTRLAVARECRQSGSGAAVLAVSDPGFTAPSMPFELPSGTVVDIPAKMRFGVSDAILGNKEESVSLREEALAEAQELLSKRTAEADEDDDDDNDEAGDVKMGDSKKDDADKEYYEGVFSEGASVGLLKKRQDSSSKAQRRPFSHTWKYLKKANGPFLQSQQEQLTSASIPAAICDAAFRCDRDQQAQLLANVVVAGGGSCIGPTEQALGEYLRQQIETIIHQHTPGWRVKVLSPSFQERSVCSWLGGSILGSLGTFHDMWITKKEYDEWGSAIVNRKCP